VSSEVKAIPTVIEELAQQHPNNTWMTIPNDPELCNGLRNITYRELSLAVKGLASWISKEIGIGKIDIDTAAYIGVNDMGYAVAGSACIRAGYKALLPSPRNSQEGQASLFKTTNCNTLLHSAGVDSYVETIRTALPDIRVYQIPSFDDLLEIGANTTEPLHAYTDKEDDIVVILHTSGSTGLPKPIYHNNGSIHVMGQLRNLPVPDGRRNTQIALFQPDVPMPTVAPFFHMMGRAITWASVLNRAPIVVLPPEKPVNADIIIKVLEQARPRQMISPPSVLEEVVEAPGGLDALSKLDYVFFGGGPLATLTGEKLIKVTKLVSSPLAYRKIRMTGSISSGPLARELTWNWTVIKPADRRFQGVFHTFPNIKEWRTKDLFEQHPEKKGLWLYKGRKDDVIVLSNGEKFNPVGFEKIMESHPLVKGAVVVGQARFQTGLLIEPEWSLVSESEDPTRLLDQIWPLIERANAEAPGHGRVWRSDIAIAKRDKPFKRTPKSSIARRWTVELYNREIDALYSNEGTDEAVGKLPADADPDTTKDFLRKLFRVKELSIPDSASEDDDIFSFGTDSLQILALASSLSHACSEGREVTISPRDVYAHPTINSLAQFLQHGGEDSQISCEETMAKMVKKYTHGLSRKRGPADIRQPEQHTYILTGSTGSLGNYALQQLIASPSVAHIYCLNRSADAESRQRQTFQERGAPTDFSNVTFLQSDFSKDQFGLKDDVYGTMLDTVDLFIHNAWAMDFNKTLQTYESTHIAGTRRVVDFSLESKYRAHIVFRWRLPAIHPGETEVPEQMFDDHRIPIPGGYGESKHVASLILAAAAENAGVPASVIRAGQLAGPYGEGQPWNKHEWLPSIVISSKALSMVPERLGNQDEIDWVPMDLAARSVIDMSESRTQPDQDVLAVAHLVNPQAVSWSKIVPTVRDALEAETGNKVEVVPFRQWLDELKKSPATPEEVEKKPGIKLIDFYEGLLSEGGGLPQLSTSETEKLSTTVRTMKAVDEGLMKKWLGQWRE
ncbi:Non-canonical non-ribosomal peptide synthetase FUB8, partial [Fulvia fulva]